MLRKPIGALVLVLLTAQGCASGVGQAVPSTPRALGSEVRLVQNPRDLSTSLILDPITIQSAPAGQVLLGGMYVRSGTGGPDGGTVLVLQVRRSTPEAVLSNGVRLQLEADGFRMPPIAIGPGMLHRTRQADGEWLETLLIPIDALQLVRIANASVAQLRVASSPPITVGRALQMGFQDFVGRLPESEMTATASSYAIS